MTQKQTKNTGEENWIFYKIDKNPLKENNMRMGSILNWICIMKKCPSGYTCRIQNVPFHRTSEQEYNYDKTYKSMTHFPIRDEGVQTIYDWDWDGMILVSSLCSNFKWQSKNVLNRGCQSNFHFFTTLLFGCHSHSQRSQYESKMKEKILAICFYLNFRDISAVRDVLIQWIKINDT